MSGLEKDSGLAGISDLLRQYRQSSAEYSVNVKLRECHSQSEPRESEQAQVQTLVGEILRPEFIPALHPGQALRQGK